ncbi:MAG: AIR synthase related protein [Kiritimatiellae bacterium]|jgi:hydrogenase expression/formation protein HypE|nr:AIR synthase related protein [Kiritimatiellia bacterium]
MKNKKLINGKLDPNLLEELLENIVSDDETLILGPQVGADCALVKLSEGTYAIGTDPITFDVSRPGYYAVHINANDVAVSGAIPSYYTQTIILPTDTTLSELNSIVEDSIKTAKSLGITLIGGHTEISDVVKRPLISICMFGQTINKKNLLPTLLPEDVVIQVNPLAMEGTAILAEMFEEKLSIKLGKQYIQNAKDLIYKPGLSVVVPAVYASKNLQVKLMHDPTEGGIITGLREMVGQSQCGITVYQENFIIKDETIKICDICGCNPLGLISSGTLLAIFDKNDVESALQSFKKHGYECSIVATLTNDKNVYNTQIGETLEPLEEFNVDELAKINT